MLIVFQYLVAAGQSHVSAGGNFNQQLYRKCNNEILLTLEARCRPSVANVPIQTSVTFIINEIRLSRCVPWFHSHNDFPWTDKIVQGHGETICSCLIKDSRSGFLIKNTCLLSTHHNNKSSDQHTEAPTPFCLYSSRSALLCCHLTL